MIHSKIFRRDFCFVMNISSYRSSLHARRGGPGPFHLTLIICSMSIFPLLIFLKVFFRVKTGKVEEIFIGKWYNGWLDLLASMLLLGPDLH